MQKSLKDEAREYVPPTTKNIAELEVVRTDAEVIEKEYEKDDGTSFKVKVIVVDGIDYRVPVSVVKALKAILEEKPDLKAVKVKKTGEGFKTTYTVVSLD